MMTEQVRFERPDFCPATDKVLTLRPIDSWPVAKHRFDERSIRAVRTALAAERPLLIRGKPGIGKSQLARAVAQELNLPFLYHVVNARTEHSDLLYEYDAVSRLAEAQVRQPSGSASLWRPELAADRFVRPQVLWWAFDWRHARLQTKKWCRTEGCDDRGPERCCDSCCEPAHPPEGPEPGGWLPDADAGLEHDLRCHPEVSAVAGVCALKPQHVDRRMEELIAEDDKYLNRLTLQLPELLRRHHRFHGVLLRASEIYNLRAAQLPVNDEELARAQSAFQAGNRTRWEQIESAAGSQRPGDQLGLAAWNARELARKSHARAQEDRELAAASALEALAAGSAAEPPEGIHQATFRQTWQWALAKHGEPQPRLWQLRQHGRTLQLESPGEPCSAGTPLAQVRTANPGVFLTFNNRSNSSDVYFRADREDGRQCSLGMPDRISLGSDCCELDLLTVPPPGWASRFGWDRFGLFADFELDGVVFPLRWIPPGEFQMGSPKEEPGRYDDEGPQHRVTIGRGFWMATTPVTQAQYAAVTGQRPSHFQHAGDRAPVEQVAWDDCRKFCHQLQQKVARAGSRRAQLRRDRPGQSTERPGGAGGVPPAAVRRRAPQRRFDTKIRADRT